MRVLMLTPMEPLPPIGGCRSVYHSDLKLLHARGHEVHLLSLTALPDADPSGLAPLATAEYFHAPRRSRVAQILRNLGSRVPFSIERQRHPALLARAVERVREGGIDVVFVQELAMAEYAERLRARVDVPIYFRGHTVHTEVLRRFQASQRNPLLRLLAWRQVVKCADFEARVVREVDGVSEISEVDAAAIRRASGREDVDVLFPSVDPRAFEAGSCDEREPDTVIHCGTLEPITTLPAMLWFVREVWPRVRARRPSARLELVGRTAPSALDRLGSEGVHVIGPVPEMAPHLRRGAVFVSPMLVGSGIRISLLNAMASGNAIVATHVAAEGIPYTHGEDLFASDDPAELADAVCRLLEDPALRRRVGASARRTVASDLFSAAKNAERLEAQLLHAIDVARARRAQ